MNIKLGKTSGFCYGVKNAVDKTKQALEERKKSNEKLYCLGELVHNKTITNKLKQDGLIFIEDIEQADGTTIIRAHGVEKKVYEKAKNKNIELIDLTCPSVLKIHEIAENYATQGYYIFLVGKKGHPEIIGTYSFCGENSTIISDVGDIEEAIKNLTNSRLKQLLIIAQTTYSIKKFDEIVKIIKEKVSNEIQVNVKNTICLATEKRQEETKKLSKEVDLMIIVGGKNSSNTNKLYEIAKANCKNAIFVEDKNDIEKGLLSKYENIGIMAGASTPQEDVDEIILVEKFNSLPTLESEVSDEKKSNCRKLENEYASK